MFGKKAESPPEPTVIGQGALIEGIVRTSGPVMVDGAVDGALLADGPVVVSATGSISGELVASELDLHGSVVGKLNVREHLHVAAGAVARGEIRYGSLQVDRGGVIDGNALHGGDGTSTTLAPEADRSGLVPPLPAAG